MPVTLATYLLGNALRLLTLALLFALAAGPAYSQGTELMPGVTYEKIVQFTPHGAVALHVLTAPRPGDQGGLYQLAPLLSGGRMTGTPETVTQLERDVSSSGDGRRHQR